MAPKGSGVRQRLGIDAEHDAVPAGDDEEPRATARTRIDPNNYKFKATKSIQCFGKSDI